MPRAWIAVACAAHVRLGRAEGFMQVCHGKAAPLRRIAPGDLVAYYSPTESLGGGDRLQAFTALGTVRSGAPYQPAAPAGFRPWRRDVDWWPGREAPIRPLLERLSFSSGDPRWGYRLRFGLFEVTQEDARLIAGAMEAACAVS
ncbi:EVE domain-containing protein [Rhodovarius crocodyli]|uniref:UPF0310 protein EOD42_09565 n=1 Tax=Rhodovarius crocodyli TaxID=1979269 RepID=A0A437MGC7_9PROT|nr:EVE domain-containing protein [Rhodovarius crocodyli]RVT96655.1 EVE domain-containing protein [Rhodovarius crocodyli]